MAVQVGRFGLAIPEIQWIVIAYLLTGEVRNAVNLPYLDAKTSEQVKPYLPLGEALGKLLSQLAPAGADKLHITYGGNAKNLTNIDPVTRAVIRGFLSTSNLNDVNNVNVRSVAQSIGIPHYVLDFEARFRDAVMASFADAYVNGETPVPCVTCNETVKFTDLIAVARDLDLVFVGEPVKHEFFCDSGEDFRSERLLCFGQHMSLQG